MTKSLSSPPLGRASAAPSPRPSRLKAHRVVATDLEVAKLEGLKGKLLKLDARSTKDVKAAAEDVMKNVGPLDVLVNCAGYVHQGNVLECSEDDWDLSFDLNVKSIHRMLSAFLPHMLREWRRIGHQHLLRSLLDQRRSQPLCLWDDQGRHHRPDQGSRRRLHKARHPCQRDLPRHDQLTFARTADRSLWPRRTANLRRK